MDKIIPGWMHPKDLAVIATLAAEVSPEGSIAEIGSWLGQSTYCWATNTKSRVFALDLWEWMPAKYEGVGQELVDLDGDPYLQFHDNVGHLPNIIPLKRNSSGGVWPYGEVDIAFIDAMHQDPWVGEDIRYWENNVKPGGVICGDDYAKKFPAVMREAQKCAERWNTKLELPGQKFWMVRKPL